MKKNYENEEKIFHVEHEIKQQILDIIVIVIIFFVAMSFGKTCMNKYGGTWVSFNLPAVSTVIIGLYLGSCLKRLYITKRKGREEH